MVLPKQIKIVEVSPRDGLQNEPKEIPTALKIKFIEALAKSGLQSIEITSYVSPKWVPQLADHQAVSKALNLSSADFIALTPNQQGLEAALKDGIRHIAVFTTASEAFCKKNINCTVLESIKTIEGVVLQARKKGIRVRGYLSCVMGCPYEGKIDPEKTATIAKALHEMGCEEISLGDTIGIGTPLLCKTLIRAVRKFVPMNQLAVHFHDTYGQALTNIYSALEEGVSIVDASVAGLGGCPYAPGAGGNVATEDVLYLCDGLGIETGIDIKRVSQAGKLMTDYLGIIPRSKASIALQSANYLIKTLSASDSPDQ
jgi:hydroxymethylglutaryl-CoA lyase